MSDRPEAIDELLTGSAATAIGVAIIREQESARPDRLYEDPWAATFVARARRAFDASPGGAEGWSLLRELVRVGTTWRSTVVRILDDLVRSFVGEGCAQLVVPGVGLDTRSLRLAWPGPVTVYELDVPAMIAFRRSVLGDMPMPDGVRRVEVSADLAGDWDARLLRAGFDPARPSAWVLEAVLSYIERDAARALMARLSELPGPGSRMVLQYTSEAAQAAGTSTALRARAAAISGIGRLIPGGRRHLGPDAEAFLAELGWELEYREGSAEAAKLGRSLPPAETMDFIVGRRPGS